MKNNLGRIERLEKAVHEILNPEDKRTVSIIVDKRIGETEEQKIFEMEKELGRKLNRKNILLVYIDHYRGKHETI